MMSRYCLYFLLFLISACGMKQQVLSPRQLSIMTYNIHHANPPSKPNFIDIDAIAAAINKQKPDIVALQEVDVNTGRSKMNEAVLLRKKRR